MSAALKSSARSSSRRAPTHKVKPVVRKAPATSKGDAVATFLQAKLTVNAPDDAYEQEADSVAARIMQMPENKHATRSGSTSGVGDAVSLQRVVDDEDAPLQREAEEDEIQAKPLQREDMDDDEEVQAKPLQREAVTEEDDVQAKLLQREAMQEEDEAQAVPLQREAVAEEDDVQAMPLQREAAGEEDEVQSKPLHREAVTEEDDVQAKSLQREEEEEEAQAKPLATTARRRMNARFETRLQHLKSTGGASLAPSLQHFMENRFGRSFEHVRIHTGIDASHLAQEARARAFTVGRDIVFNRTQYRPDSDSGRRLIAHELTHVLQQKGGLHRVQREIFSPEDKGMVRSARGQDMLRQLDRLVGTNGGQLPKAIQTIVSEILRTAASGPDGEDLRGMLAEDATAAEVRRIINTADYTLRLTVQRSDTGARAEWELIRQGESDSFYRHLEQTGASMSAPEGGLDERQISLPTPLAPRYRSDSAVNPQGTRPAPAPDPDPGAIAPDSMSIAPQTASAPDTRSLAAVDGTPTASMPVSQSTNGIGDSAGTDTPQNLRAPVDQEAEDDTLSEAAVDDSDIKRSTFAAAPLDVDPEAEQLIRGTLAKPGVPLPTPLAAQMQRTLSADFSSTRIHHGPLAARAAHSIGARAFAMGDSIVFGDAQYNPATRAGRALLGHELTHIRQNREGRGARFAKRDEECPPQEPIPEVEIVSSPVGPQQDPAFTAMDGRSENRAANQSTHGSGDGKSEDANAAAEVTDGENQTHAQTDQVGTMASEAASPPAFDRSAFVASVLAEVERIAPDVLKDVVDFKSNGTAGRVKSAVESEADDAASNTQAPLEQAATEDPGPGQSPRMQQDLVVEAAGAQPGSIRADRAMPPPRTASEVDMSADTVRTENILREACISRPFMDEHADPELTGAAQAQDSLADATERAPEAYREGEASALQNAQSGASGQGRDGVRGLFESRRTNFAGVGNAQGQTAVDNARKRQLVATEVNTIFAKTQTDVTDRLDKMTADVKTTFDTEANAAVTRFEDFIRVNAERFENNWAEDLLDIVVDILFDPPPREVLQFYAEGRRTFISDMELAIGKVADIVETGLSDARELVDAGKTKVEDKLSGLGDDLADFRSEISGQMSERFRSLEGDIDSRQGDMVKSLANRYKSALEQVRDIESQVRDEYSTWVDSAQDAYNAAKDFITGWITRLRTIVGGAAARIIRNPGQFLSNVGKGIIQGLTMFKDNIFDNIKNAVVQWLTGNLGSAGIELPSTFDAKSLIGFAMELVGLGLNSIKNIARRVFGRTVVTAIEAGVAGAEHIKQLFDILVTDGPAGLYEHLRGEFERIKGEMMEKIGKALATSLVVAGIRKALGLLSGLVSGGVGTVITIVTTIIDLVLWFRDNAAQMAELVSTIASLALAVLNGNVSALANGINNVLKRLMPLALSFVGALVGIGGVVRKIQGILRAIRRPATRAVTALFRRMKNGIRRLIARMRRRGRGRGRRRGQERSKISPQNALRQIVRQLSQRTRAMSPQTALAEKKSQATRLRNEFQNRLERGQIRITFDESIPNVVQDNDIDFTVRINPKDEGDADINPARKKILRKIDSKRSSLKSKQSKVKRLRNSNSVKSRLNKSESSAIKTQIDNDIATLAEVFDESKGVGKLYAEVKKGTGDIEAHQRLYAGLISQVELLFNQLTDLKLSDADRERLAQDLRAQISGALTRATDVRSSAADILRMPVFAGLASEINDGISDVQARVSADSSSPKNVEALRKDKVAADRLRQSADRADSNSNIANAIQLPIASIDNIVLNTTAAGRDAAEVGDGSSEAAAINEVRTGIMTKGTWHGPKCRMEAQGLSNAEDRLNALKPQAQDPGVLRTIDEALEKAQNRRRGLETGANAWAARSVTHSDIWDASGNSKTS